MVKQFSIYVRDRVGELARVTEIMANHGINIIAIASEGGGSRPVIRIVTEDQASTRRALEKAGRTFTEEDILVVKLMDRPGELAKIARRLARKAINVESIYIFGKSDGRTEVAMAVDKLALAREVLGIR